jgi:hypothetical protein
MEMPETFLKGYAIHEPCWPHGQLRLRRELWVRSLWSLTSDFVGNMTVVSLFPAPGWGTHLGCWMSHTELVLSHMGQQRWRNAAIPPDLRPFHLASELR